LTKQTKKPLNVLENEVRVQDYVRSTDDIDLTVGFPEGERRNDANIAQQIYGLYGALEGVFLSGTEDHILEYGLVRKGLKRPVFGVSVDDEVGEHISMNISNRSLDLDKLPTSYYPIFIESGERLVIPYSEGYNIAIRVPKKEHLLATKASNFRAKDAMDLKNLVTVIRASGEDIDFSEVEKILGVEYAKNYDRLLSLVDHS